MFKLKKDFECVLREIKTGIDLLRFTAQQVGDPNYSADFVGGGVANGSQSFSILVDKAYDIETDEVVHKLDDRLTPLKHAVIINGHQWILTSWTPSIRRKMGAGWAAKPNTVYILNLE